MKQLENLEVWFVVGSQHLYGPEVLRQVTEHAREVVEFLNGSGDLFVDIELKATVKTPDEILAVCRDAEHATRCVGIIAWMHTFSPARMWIAGLAALTKPCLQLHTQFNARVPWNTMDMDYMNLHQTAHGGREFGFISARMRRADAVVVGHWQDKASLARIDAWMRVATAVADSRHMKIARFGDNMRDVAVTEGDKVAAQLRFGYTVNGYALGELTESVAAVTDSEVRSLLEEYEETYELSDAVRAELRGRAHRADEGGGERVAGPIPLFRRSARGDAGAGGERAVRRLADRRQPAGWQRRLAAAAPA